MEAVFVGAALGLLCGGLGLGLLGWSTPQRVRQAKVLVVEGRAAVVDPDATEDDKGGPYRGADRGVPVTALLREQRPGPSVRTVLGVLLTMLGVAFIVGGIIATMKHPAPPRPIEQASEGHASPQRYPPR